MHQPVSADEWRQMQLKMLAIAQERMLERDKEVLDLELLWVASPDVGDACEY
jgi:hypothetical protein